MKLVKYVLFCSNWWINTSNTRCFNGISFFKKKQLVYITSQHQIDLKFRFTGLNILNLTHAYVKEWISFMIILCFIHNLLYFSEEQERDDYVGRNMWYSLMRLTAFSFTLHLSILCTLKHRQTQTVKIVIIATEWVNKT